MKKSGYTLAEVLITIGVIGVIAAFTIPVFSTKSRNAAFVSAFSASMSTLENAFTTMLAREAAEDLFETEAWSDDVATDRGRFAEIMGNYCEINGFEEIDSANDVKAYYGAGKGPFVLTNNGGKSSTVNNTLAGHLFRTPGNALAGGNHLLELKNGAVVFLIINIDQNPTDERIQKIREKGGAVFNEAADIWLDVNGKAGPNTLGRDIFGFYLGDDGKLYALGSKSTGIFNNPNNPGDWKSGGSWKCSDENFDSGYGCAGRIIDEGYKMTY